MEKIEEKDKKYLINENGADVIVYLPKYEIDLQTMKQIKQMIVHPAFIKSKMRFMPDCHKGVGCCIGLTSALSEKIVPNTIGKDIGCAVLTYPIGNNKFTKKNSLKKIEKLIRQSVQMGNGHENIWDKPVVEDSV